MKTFISTVALLLAVSFGIAQTGGTSTGTTGSTSPISSFPYLNDFEIGIEWSQSGGDDFDWSRNSGGTPSSNTTTQNHHAQFIYNDSFPSSGTMTTAGPLTIVDSTPPIKAPEEDETSTATNSTTITWPDSTGPTPPQSGTSGTSTNTSTVTVVDSTSPTSGTTNTGVVTAQDSFPPKPKTAILISPIFDLSSYSKAQFAFAYSIQGPNSSLTVEMSLDGVNWTVVWTKLGGSSYSSGTASVVLPAGRSAASLQLRFLGSIGSNIAETAWEGDMTVDDLSVTATGTAGRRLFQEPGQATTIKAYPNPFQAQFSVTIPYVENETAQVAMFNLRGQQVYMQADVQSGDSFRFEPPVGPGIYVVTVKIGEMQYQTKVIKSK